MVSPVPRLESYVYDSACPHGGFTWLACFMLLVSLCMSVLSLFHCQFFEAADGGYKGLISFYVPTDSQQDADIDYAQCKFYSANDPNVDDVHLKIARAFGIGAVVLSGLVFVGSWSLCWSLWDKFGLKFFGLWIFLTAIFQGFTFFVLSSHLLCGENQCPLASGGYICIATVVLLFISGVIFNNFPKPNDEDDNLDGIDANPLLDNETRTEITETIGEDGSKVVTTTTYHPDGAVTTQVKAIASSEIV